MNPQPESWVVVIPWIGVVLAVVCLLFALSRGKRGRLVDDIPTSKSTGVFIGLVELKGTAEAESPLTSFLAARPCVYYDWRVEEHWSRTVVETYTDSKGQSRTRVRTESGWTKVAGGDELIPFYLRDDCGVVLVRPGQAQIEPATIFDETCGRGEMLYYQKGPPGAVANSTHQRRFAETAIPLHAGIYIMGQARERSDLVAPEIAHDPQAPIFLISVRSEQQVSSGYRGGFWGLGLLGLGLSVGALALASHLYALDYYIFPALAGMVYIFAWVLGWVWMAFNSLVNLRQRVRQAWSNVDVQLKRRHDLIPNLVASVEALRDHERGTQTELAALRAQTAATPPGVPGPDHAACTNLVIAIAERYPELKADSAFRNLSQNLSDTEQRIALARSYFNDIATFYNTRLQVIPDRFIAALVAMQPQALMAANEFERAPVTVNFANQT